MGPIIFACVHNAGRSQMAAAFFNQWVDNKQCSAVSAGTQPSAAVHPIVIEVMKEVGVDLSSARPQKLDTGLCQGASLLVTMGCGENCPYVPGLSVEDWPLSDPKGKSLEEVRKIRETIRSRVEELVGRLDLGKTGKPWWKTERKRLLDVVKSAAGPSFVYNLGEVRNRAQELRSLTAVDQWFYAVKANAHSDILKTIEKSGIGFECVSLNEVKKVLSEIPELSPKRILFTPNFAPRSEYETAIRIGVHLTVDNLFILKEWGELLHGREILLRVDTGEGQGHHDYVKTAGTWSKFGIPIDQLTEAAHLAKQHDIRVTGLHAHVGSGIRDAGSWARTAEKLRNVLSVFPQVKILDLGGGLGVVDRPGHSPVNLQELNRLLVHFRKENPALTLWMEPGRYLVADAGVLLARVTQVKSKGDRHYIGLETGMNSLIRPALYGAYHGIVNLSRLDTPPAWIATVVGPVCESADILGEDRALPYSEEGDVFLISQVGAYGRMMSSDYTLRGPADEQILS